MRIRSNNQKEIQTKKNKEFLCRCLIRASQTYLNYLCRLYVTHTAYMQKKNKQQKKVDSFTSRDLCPVAIYSGHDPA